MTLPNHDICPACGMESLPRIGKTEIADARMCQNPDCRAVADRWGVIEVQEDIVYEVGNNQAR